MVSDPGPGATHNPTEPVMGPERTTSQTTSATERLQSSAMPSRLPFGRLDTERMRSSLRWFAAELVVVTAGVLLALAGQAWWSAREERGRELDYLQRLLEDTRRNEREVQRLIAVDSVRREVSVAMLRILRDGAPMPSQDSLARLISMTSASNAVLATTALDALVSSGELRLLRNRTVRDSTLRIFAQVRDVQQRIDANEQRVGGFVSRRNIAMLRHLGREVRGTPNERARALDTEWVHRVDFGALRRDPEGIAPFQDHVYARNNSLGSLRRLRQALVPYRTQLEAAIAALGG